MTLLAEVAEHTTRLLTTAQSLDDPAAPSLCAGWSRGHVLAHLARNAEGIERLVRSAVDGTGETMYAGDRERDDDIDAGAGRDVPALVADIRDTAVPLAAQLARLGDAESDVLVERTPGGPTFRAGALPFMRLRELVYHHVDLAAGFTFADVAPEVLDRFLANECKQLDRSAEAPSLTLRVDDGPTLVVGGGAHEVRGSRAGLLLWLARQDPSEVRAGSGGPGDVPDLAAGR